MNTKENKGDKFLITNVMGFKMYFMNILAFFFVSCHDELPMAVDGMKAIYISYDDVSMIRSEPPRQIYDGGKIVSYEHWLLVGERNQGIHLIDNTNQGAPEAKLFFNIPGNHSFIVKDDILYADNGRHLLVINMDDVEHISLLEVIKDVYEWDDEELFPFDYKGWFECYDPSKGILTGWEIQRLVDPKCQTL